jgi:hypothetical protein
MSAHLPRIALAALFATAAIFVLGGILFGALTAMRKEFERHTALFRPREQMKKVMPLGMISMYVAVFAATFIFALGFPDGASLRIGAQFGLMLAVFVVCGFVLHNHMNLQISTRLTVYQAIAYFIEWFVVGLLISVFYKG